VEFYIDIDERVSDKAIFDLLWKEKEALEQSFGEPFTWERLPDRRASRIAVYHPGAITDDEESLSQLRDWAVSTMLRFYQVLSGPALEILKKVQSGDAMNPS
jgi:hypothetical protein